MVLAGAGSEPVSTATVLSRMDRAAPAFRSLAARLERTTHTAIINDTTTEKGELRMAKGKGSGVRVLIEFHSPDVKTVAFNDRRAEIYYPKMQTVQVYDLGKQKALVEEFLLLGFGAAGKDLERSYKVDYAGPANYGQQACSLLKLLPKSARVRENFNRIELCIAESGGHPVLQKLYEPSGNYTEIVYFDVKINPALTPNNLALRLPKNVKREFPQR